MKTIWYTRCPVATASGLAFQRGLFDEEFAGSDYQVRNLRELGRDKMSSHFDHSLDSAFREGGNIPPTWARHSGADTLLVGLTFVADSLCIYVREDDPAQSFTDLRGRRAGISTRPDAMIDFMRVNGHKAFDSALQAHGMSANDLEYTPVIIRDDIQGKLNPNYTKASKRKDDSFYEPDIHALLNGQTDAFFAKNAECRFIERQYAGQIRKLYDLLDAQDEKLKVNANPRVISVSGALARDYPEAVVRYLQVLVRTAHWASENPGSAADTMAVELGVEKEDIFSSYEDNFHKKLWPNLSEHSLSLLENQHHFMLEHNYLPSSLDMGSWIDDSFLREAYRRENLPWAR